jgi:hypothetical protein
MATTTLLKSEIHNGRVFVIGGSSLINPLYKAGCIPHFIRNGFVSFALYMKEFLPGLESPSLTIS